MWTKDKSLPFVIIRMADFYCLTVYIIITYSLFTFPPSLRRSASATEQQPWNNRALLILSYFTLSDFLPSKARWTNILPAAMTEFWLISAPGEKTCQQTWDKLMVATARANNLSVNNKFNIPDLKVKHGSHVYFPPTTSLVVVFVNTFVCLSPNRSEH